MKNTKLPITLCLCGFLAAVPSQHSLYAQTIKELSAIALKETNQGVLLDNFEEDEPGTLPIAWLNRDGDDIPSTYSGKDRQEYEYEIVEEDGNRFLRYNGSSAKHLNFPLRNRPNLDLSETPILRWRWRAHELPNGADERDDKLNDTAASVYIVFEMGKVLIQRVPKSIRFTWSTTVPTGKGFDKLYGNQWIFVQESGRESLGQWVTEEVDLESLYRTVFGDKVPQKPLALLILSDANSTQTFAAADYDDIELIRREEASNPFQ